jgi:hypothetical protein
LGITKGGKKVITIGGTIGNITVGGQPVTDVGLFIEMNPNGQGYENIGPGVDKTAKTWSFKKVPFSVNTTLTFTVNFTAQDGTVLEYHWSDFTATVKDTDKIDIKIPDINLPALITLSGTANPTITGGTWEGADKSRLIIVNRSLKDGETSGWTSASTKLNPDGTWSLKVPQIDAATQQPEVKFTMRYLESNEDTGTWNCGNKNNLKPTTIGKANISNIDLGTVQFVMVSGNTSVFVDGKAPYFAFIGFDKYGDGENGWTGEVGQPSVPNGPGAWSIPLPANTALNANVTYFEDSREQLRKSTPSIAIDTGSAAMTVNLDNIANITTDAVMYTILSGTIGNITLDGSPYTDLAQAKLEFCVYGVEYDGNGEVYYSWREYLGDTKINADKSWTARIRPLGSSETSSIDVGIRDPNDPNSWC